MRVHGRQRNLWIAAAAFVLAAGCTNTPGARIGEVCESHDDCGNRAQCFSGVCAPACEIHADCGGGYLCATGVCERVDSAVGDACARELDCGPRQSCQLDDDDDGDGELAASCQPEQSGSVTGAACSADDDCRTGLCALGQCTELCETETDCPGALACVSMPRLLPDAAPVFAGCMQRAGSIELTFPMPSPRAVLRIPVPSNARSFALVAQVDDPTQNVGALRIAQPNGDVLYTVPGDEDDYYANRLRYAPGRQITTLLVPNAPHVPLHFGAYEIEIAASEPDGRLSSSIPSVTVMYRLGGLGREVDLNLHFVGLANHPCGKAFRAGLDAKSAAEAGPVRDVFVPELARIFGDASMSIGEVTFSDIANRPRLAALAPDELPSLLREARLRGGVDVFFVRSIDPPGVQALVAGTPGAPGIPQTAASGIALSVDTLCYRPWKSLARTAAHAIARHLGLFPNVGPDGRDDPIVDTDDSADNLLYFSEFGGTQLSAGQSEVLRSNPVVK